jgi:hypothetical protein
MHDVFDLVRPRPQLFVIAASDEDSREVYLSSFEGQTDDDEFEVGVWAVDEDEGLTLTWHQAVMLLWVLRFGEIAYAKAKVVGDAVEATR